MFHFIKTIIQHKAKTTQYTYLYKSLFIKSDNKLLNLSPNFVSRQYSTNVKYNF